tara:strand:+ start:69 stop:659 length:591 start_codon:yes stop_codon:yes gene_type:complete
MAEDTEDLIDMSRQQCEQCDTAYDELQRAGEDRLYACQACRCELCDRCIEHEPSGPQVCFLRCPNCGGQSFKQLKLSNRFSIYSSLIELKDAGNAIALLFIPRSVYSKRNELIIRETIPRLQEFSPSFSLLNENDASIRSEISGWFPSVCNPKEATGKGAVIWLKNGQPVSALHGGPYLTKLEILEHSRTAWFYRH